MKTLSSYLLRTFGFAATTTVLLSAPFMVSAWNTPPSPGPSTGSQTYSAPGTYTFIVPNYTGSLTVEAWGGGGGSGGSHRDGGASTFASLVSAGGGGANNGSNAGIGGIASGGDVNVNGNTGDYWQLYVNNIDGGSAQFGGSGGRNCTSDRDGHSPGGGGAGCNWYTGGSGAGAYVKKTYAVGALQPGSSIQVVVGAGANGVSTPGSGPSNGGDGLVKITWGGSQTYSTPGSYAFTVPQYGTLTVELWGGGGAGATGGNGAGSASSWNGVVVAGGGSGASGSNGGAGGVATGGSVNQNGGNGENWALYDNFINGGDASLGGTGGHATESCNGRSPGGGGAGCNYYTGAGGGGAYSKVTYTAGQIAAGTVIPVVVGAGHPGTSSAGAGAPGAVKITWSDGASAAPAPAFSQSTTVIPNPTVGSIDTITTTIKNIGGAANALVDIEVYQNGVGIGQKVFDNQSFAANQSHTYSFPFSVTAPGTYTVSIGVFKPGWSGLYTWFDQIASFTAVSGGGGGGGQALSIYQDALAQGWENWSWGSTQNFFDASLVF
ncbi:hypothetical protein HYT05_05085, partial [Candidatus Kaiserbacteria bacterium]|nr:hypothetical protein [Candidatus Kaiserbacteria bacterium]